MRQAAASCVLTAFAIAFACAPFPKEVKTNPAVKAQRFPAESFDSLIDEHADSLMEQGRQVFRYDTFGIDRSVTSCYRKEA